MPTQVIDVSSNQKHPIDWSAVRKSGREAVIVKLTENGGAHGYVNPFAAKDIADAKAAGLLVAGYHFFHPEIPVATQLAFILLHLDHVKTVWVDSESLTVGWGAEGPDTHAMLNALKPHVKTGLYSNPNFLQHMAGAPWGYPLWLAEYGPKASYPFTLWQFESNGSVPGIQGPCDVSLFQGTDAALKTLFA
jgi:lysozyme